MDIEDDIRLNELETKIGVSFNDKGLLLEALTHRSFVNENRDYGLHNERLELLGDAVLEMVVTEHLFVGFPELPEGKLTNLRSSVIQGKVLSGLATGLGLGGYLRMSRGQARAGYKDGAKLLADAFEALVAAIYLDQGYRVAKRFIGQTVLMELSYVMEEGKVLDPFGALQEITQRLFGITPSYNILSEEGPDHERSFVAGIYLDSVLISKGVGPSKLEARSDGARNALQEQSSWEDSPNLPRKQ